MTYFSFRDAVMRGQNASQRWLKPAPEMAEASPSQPPDPVSMTQQERAPQLRGAQQLAYLVQLASGTTAILT